MKKGQRCILTGKLIEGKDVIIASEILQYIEKQGSIFIDKNKVKLKNEKSMDTTIDVGFSNNTSYGSI